VGRAPCVTSYAVRVGHCPGGGIGRHSVGDGWAEPPASPVTLYELDIARVAELADAGGLNPPDPRGSCGFESRPGH
jgi:hypothetical protein